MSHVVQLLSLKAAVDKIGNLSVMLKDLAQASRDDRGCIVYDVFSGDQGVFKVLEVWTNQQALDDHIAMPHTSAALAAFPGLLAEAPAVEVLSALSVAAIG
ncbi:putative quinol monooxygenase [Pseudomonas sp.]|uniref:putative quinol monooxygenase n=1 Tax=Pseudomonas sp. TaxID=306 RepID=UPI003D11AE11